MIDEIKNGVAERTDRRRGKIVFGAEGTQSSPRHARGHTERRAQRRHISSIGGFAVAELIKRLVQFTRCDVLAFGAKQEMFNSRFNGMHNQRMPTSIGGTGIRRDRDWVVRGVLVYILLNCWQ